MSDDKEKTFKDGTPETSSDLLNTDTVSAKTASDAEPSASVGTPDAGAAQTADSAEKSEPASDSGVKDTPAVTEAAPSMQIDSREFAERLYDLDKLVYDLSGSSLGRVFTSDRDHAVNIIEKALNMQRENIIRSELALIGNMARTIQDKADHYTALSAYNEMIGIYRQIVAEPASLITTEQDRSLNELNLENRFTRENRLIICISRSYGSAANNVGLGIADALHINYYDAEILMRLIQRRSDQGSKIPLTKAETDMIDFQLDAGNPGLAYRKEKLTMKERYQHFNRYHGLPSRDAYFFAESELLVELAKEQDYVVMGRCADSVMHSNNIPHVSIFLTAPEKRRIKRIMRVNNVDERTAKRQMHQVDRQRAEYYEFFTNHKWNNGANYDLTLNTATFGVRGTIDFILQILDNAGLGGKR